jgi:hypothetical protein
MLHTQPHANQRPHQTRTAYVAALQRALFRVKHREAVAAERLTGYCGIGDEARGTSHKAS